MPKCPHNRKKKTICKECGGGSIFQHKRLKSQCKECGGGSICPHNRQKYRCKECLADKDNTIPEVEEYTKEEYEIISFLVKK